MCIFLFKDKISQNALIFLPSNIRGHKEENILFFTNLCNRFLHKIMHKHNLFFLFLDLFTIHCYSFFQIRSHSRSHFPRKVQLTLQGEEKPNEGKSSFWPIRKYNFYEEYLRKLNNQTMLENAMLRSGMTEEEKRLDDLASESERFAFEFNEDGDAEDPSQEDKFPFLNATQKQLFTITIQPIKQIMKRNFENKNQSDEDDDNDNDDRKEFLKKWNQGKVKTMKKSKSENFEVIDKCDTKFDDIGGYDLIKQELNQCIDIMIHYSKYEGYNVRIPKGLILEGPPGNGKTLLAKGFAGETNASFITVSGAQFQDKYVGVGASRVRELFELAEQHIPCVIFIDEIDALGRKRSVDGEASSSERDNTLNELLIALDGFKSLQGIFFIAATNRADMLDPALLRPGRIDKRIYIGPPDAATRRAILDIHLRGKPYNNTTVTVDELVEMTLGFSGAQIENLLNEAMLYALRNNRPVMNYNDLDFVMNKMMMGWQPNEHEYTEDIIDRIAIHEMGHAIVGYYSKNHAKVRKVSINLSSPTTPGFTLFEGNVVNIHKKEYLFEHLMILLAGRIAEEEFYNMSTTTGASADFEQAFKLAEQMVLFYGMGRNNLIYSSQSDYYKEKVDEEVMYLINNAYKMAKAMVKEYKTCIKKGAEILKQDRIIKQERLTQLLYECAISESFEDYPLVP